MEKLLALLLTMALMAPQQLNQISFKQDSYFFGSGPQNIYTLEARLQDGMVEVEQGLSFGSLYGVETTSEIAKREQALVGVNGMFYNDLGRPLGMMIQKGVPISIMNIKTPMVVFSDKGQGAIVDMTLTGKLKIGEQLIALHSVNDVTYDGQTGLYTKDYGRTTRVSRMSTNYLVREGRLVDIIVTDQPVQLQGYDFVITRVKPMDPIQAQVGERCEVIYDYSFKDFVIDEGFQSGGWVVKDGVNVAEDFGIFVGHTTAPAPRTLIGLTQDGTLIIKVVDGRDAKKSLGLSGSQSAELMLAAGCVNAVYLDGGASSTMVIDGIVVNEPSEGYERAVAHGLFLNYSVDE